MAKNIGKKGKINISKKTLNKIEIIIFVLVLLVGIVVFFNTRTLSSRKALEKSWEVYENAEDVLSKVLIDTDWIDLSDSCIEQNGYTFCLPNTKGLQSYSDLKDYIKSVCTKELTDSILKEKDVVFKNVDNKLYVLPSSRTTDIFYKDVKEIKVLEISSHEIKCEVICNYYVDLEKKEELYTMAYDFIIKKQWGTWKASYFELPY